MFEFRSQIRSALLALLWSLFLIIPHFQPSLNLSIFIFDFFLAILFFKLVLNEEWQNLAFHKFFLLIPFILPVFFLLLIQFNIDFPYLLFTRLGAYTMFSEGHVQPFGDLIHLTAAANCATEILVGDNLCDPWNRAFNQNPDVVILMKYFGIHNIYLFGIFAILLLGVGVWLVSKQLDRVNVILLLSLLTPPLVLAIDRGNELITVGLMLIASEIFFRSTSRYSEVLGALLLMVASVFKLWPLVVFLFAMLLLKRRSIPVISGFMITLIYWLFNFKNALAMVKNTQGASPFGTGFGLQLTLFFQENVGLLLISALVTLILAFKSIRYIYLNLCEDSELLRDRNFRYSLLYLFSYVAIWLVGQNFIYRMIVLIPSLYYLQRIKSGNSSALNFIRALIFLALVSSRLPITVVVTNLLGIVSIGILIIFILSERKISQS